MKTFPEPLEFDWNAASNRDWHYIERNFIAAYFNAYKESDLADLAISPPILHEAEEIWAAAYTQASEGNFNALQKNIFNLLTPLLHYALTKPMPEALSAEKEALRAHFKLRKITDITDIKENLIKLTALALYFKEEYEVEKNKIMEQDWRSPRRIHYLVARCHNQPVAFFSFQLNNKTGRIYMRWVTISPSAQRLGLGKILLEKVNQYFPVNTGMELYTRLANLPAQNFYKKIGFVGTREFDFDEPDSTDPLSTQPGYFARFVRGWLSQNTTCCAPADEAVSEPQDFIGFVKRKRLLP